MKSIYNLSGATLLFLFILTSCGEKKEAETENNSVDTTSQEPADTTKINEITEFKFHVFLANIPSPFEQMILLPETGIVIDKSNTNSVENAGNYSTTAKKALNYGVYGADLGYLAVYDQTQEITDYFATLKSMAEELGAGNQFNTVLSDRFNANIENHDSILVIMDKALGETENYLKNNERLEIATFMLIGSWVETQHIILRSLLEGSNHGDLSKLYATIPPQKTHLKSLIDLLVDQKAKGAQEMKSELEKVKIVYDAITGQEISEKQLRELDSPVKILREKIISK